MSKVKLNVFLSQNGNSIIDSELSGILDSHSIKYVFDGVINIFDFDGLSLKRVFKAYDLLIDFSNLNICYFVDNSKIDMNFCLIDNKIGNNSYYFKYCILDSNDIFEYRISYDIY